MRYLVSFGERYQAQAAAQIELNATFAFNALSFGKDCCLRVERFGGKILPGVVQATAIKTRRGFACAETGDNEQSLSISSDLH